MAEVAEESTHITSSQPRTALFLAAMRHFALELQQAGRPVHYMHLDDAGNRGSLAAQLQADLLRLRPDMVLDLGSGRGAGARMLRERYAGCTAVELDISIAMLVQPEAGATWWRRGTTSGRTTP